MPIATTTSLITRPPSPGGREGDGRGGQGVRSLATAPTAPSRAYGFAVKLNGTFLPPAHLLGPLEIEESIDTIAVLFSFTLTGRTYSIHLTETTWTAAPVEVWVTILPPLSRSAGEGAGGRGWLRAFGHVLACEPQEGPEPTLKIRCGDPSRLYDRIELCAEIPADAGLTRGEICAALLTDLGLTAAFPADTPTGALYTKPVVTDSQRVWDFLKAFGEPETWSWRFIDWTTVQATPVALIQPPEPPDDVWTLRDVLSIESTPPADVPSQWVIRGTEVRTGPEDLQITTTTSEVLDFYAVKKAVAQQLTDGTHQPLSPQIFEQFQLVSRLQTETHHQAGRLVTKITREWGWYNPRAAKLRTLSADETPGPVEGGYYWAQAFLDEEGRYRAWPQEQFVQKGERRETPTYAADGTETGRRIETDRWYARPMATRSVGSTVPNVIGAGVGDDDLSWFPFERALTALLRIEEFGLAQRDEIEIEYGPTGAAHRQVEEVSTWFSPRTAVAGVPWYLNYSGAGQKDLLAPFQRAARKVTTNTLTEDGLLAGTIETTQGYAAPRRVEGAFEWGDHRSNLQQESWATTSLKTTLYNVLDESTYEEVTDDGTGSRTHLVIGRAPRPRYRQSTWTTLVQTPIELLLEDPVAATWWGPSTEFLTLDHAQSLTEARLIAERRRARRLAITHTVIRPITHIRPGATILLIDPRTGLHHRCLVTRLTERWLLAPRPQILATYTLEQPL
jgi:hypothetical protein